MFVETVADIDAPLPTVERRLKSLISDGDSESGVVFRQEGELRARVGPKGVSRQVSLEVWKPEVHWYGVVYPFRWRAVAATKLFPELNADLVFSNEGRSRTRVTLRGTYEPPLGSVGLMADRTLLSRLAESTVTEWMGRLVGALSLSSA